MHKIKPNKMYAKCEPGTKSFQTRSCSQLIDAGKGKTVSIGVTLGIPTTPQTVPVPRYS